MNAHHNQDQVVVPTFKKATIHEIFRQVWAKDRLSSLASTSQPPPKINDPALHLSVEYLRLFTIELLHRASHQADLDQNDHQQAQLSTDHQTEDGGIKSSQDFELGGLIEVKHLQKVAPGVLLDF